MLNNDIPRDYLGVLENVLQTQFEIPNAGTKSLISLKACDIYDILLLN